MLVFSRAQSLPIFNRWRDDVNTLVAASELGRVLLQRSKLAEAEPFLFRALERQERKLGRDHPDTLFGVNDVGSLLLEQGRPAEAEPYFARGLKGMERTLGSEHPETLTSRHLLARVLYAQGALSGGEKVDASVAQFREALAGMERTLGRDHFQYSVQDLRKRAEGCLFCGLSRKRSRKKRRNVEDRESSAMRRRRGRMRCALVIAIIRRRSCFFGLYIGIEIGMVSAWLGRFRPTSTRGGAIVRW